MSIGSRVKKLIDNKGITPYEVSMVTKISQSTLSRIINDGSKKPNIRNTELLAKYFNVSKEYLLTGVGEMFKTDNQVIKLAAKHKNTEAISINYSEMNVMLVPIVSNYAYAGYLNGFGDSEFLDELPKVAWADDKEHRGEYLCFEVRGDSMDDGTTESIMENDIILCRNVKQEFWKSKLHISKWDFVIVHKEKGILVKRIIKHDVDVGILTLHSLNDYYEDFEVHLKDIAKILNVVDLKRKHKRR